MNALDPRLPLPRLSQIRLEPVRRRSRPSNSRRGNRRGDELVRQGRERASGKPLAFYDWYVVSALFWFVVQAVYEVVYEARNRPTWLDIPLSAIDRIGGSR